MGGHIHVYDVQNVRTAETSRPAEVCQRAYRIDRLTKRRSGLGIHWLSSQESDRLFFPLHIPGRPITSTIAMRHFSHSRRA